MSNVPDEIESCQEEVAPIERDEEHDKFQRRWEHERIIIHRGTFSYMMAKAGKDFPEMWTLYCFYYEKARKDKTSKPWALDRYCINGLGWSKDRFYRVKRLLVEHKFLEQAPDRDEHGRVKKMYIKVMGMAKHYCPGKTDSSESLIVVKPETSALINIPEVLESKNDNADVAENVPAAKEKNEIPQAYIIKYGIERIDEVRRNTPAGAFNPVGWQIKALDGDYGHDPKAPPGWIPGDKMPTVNGPGVFWLEGSNVDVLYHGKHYHEEHKDGEIWYVPVEEYANSNAG
jgi:hypothetical protein